MSGSERGERPKYRCKIRRLIDLGIHRMLQTNNGKNSGQPKDKRLEQGQECSGKVQERETSEKEGALIDKRKLRCSVF